MYLNVNTLLSIFAFLVRQLLKTADGHERAAQDVQDQIDKLSAVKQLKVKEAKRAQVAADKINDLIS